MHGSVYFHNPAALQPLRWPYGVLKCCAGHANKWNLQINVQTKSPTKPTALWREHNFGAAGQTVQYPTKRSALWREIQFGRSAYILRKIFLVGFFIELKELYAVRWPSFSANFQGIVVQVHQLYAPRCGKTHILAWQLLGCF